MRVHAYRGARPFAIELAGHDLVVLLVVAVIAQEHDVAESGEPEAARRGIEHLAVHVRRHRDRSRITHVPRRRVDAALGHVGDDRGDQRVAELSRDPAGQHLRAHVVLAEHHVRPVLLGAADRHQDRRLAGSVPRRRVPATSGPRGRRSPAAARARRARTRPARQRGAGATSDGAWAHFKRRRFPSLGA